MDREKEKQARVSFIFATIFLDALGIGILIPILPDLLRHFSSDPSFVSRFYGYFISSYALLNFLASPILGALSDRFGRRPVLLVSLIGSGLDYLVMAFAPSVLLLFLGRLISGLTGASMTVATAYMADISDDKNRSTNFGMIGAAWGLGFIAGPSLGGLLVGLGFRYPFFAAAALNLLNFAFGYFILPESLKVTERRNVDIKKLNPFISLAKVLKRSPTLLLIWIYVLLNLAGQVHPSTWTLYTQLKFGWSAFQVGLSISFIGFAIAIVQGGLTRFIIPYLGEWKSVAFGIVASVLGYLGFALATKGWMIYAILAPSALAGVGGPAIQSLISKDTPSREQGELQGSLTSLMSLTGIVGPLLYTLFFNFFTKPQGIYLPGVSYYLATFICIVAGALLLLSRNQNHAR